ncbi:MAG: hypothetical protein ABIN08_25855 [Caldimonas sp.]
MPAGNPSPLNLAIVYPGDSEARYLATRSNNRFATLFAAFAAQGVEAFSISYPRAPL